MNRAATSAIARRTFYLLGSGGLLVAALYWGQKIFIPLALAILLSFVLSPLVIQLERRGLRRLSAVVLVVGLAFLLLGLAGWSIATQVTALISDLPGHQSAVREKIAQLQGAGKHGLLATVQAFLDEVEKAGRPADQGLVVRVQPDRPSLFAQLQAVLGQFLGVLSIAVAVVLLVVALLTHREDLRNRIIHLAGRGRLTLTTRALDEAARRIGGYLLGHSIVNTGFGAAVGLGLFLIGVQYPALWGLLAGALRFVPSVGVWLVAPFPAALAFISLPTPTQALEVLALFLVLELATTNFIEKRVCGPSIGIGPVPLLLAVLFWTGLWGIVGLVLATPMTVCLAVLGKYVRPLHFLAVLLGSRPALSPEARYYQRLVARDRHEAEAVVKEYLVERSVEQLFDDVLVPALVLMRRGRQSAELSSEDEQFILGTTGELIQKLTPEAATAPDGETPVTVVGLPARDEADEATLLMLRCLARRAGHDLLLPATGPPGITGLAQAEPAGVIIASLAPKGLTQARYLSRRLRAQAPGLKITVARLGQLRESRKMRGLFLSAGADRVVATLREALRQLTQLPRVPSNLQKAAGG
jgi:predicted PurR-regulated permease PerM